MLAKVIKTKRDGLTAKTIFTQRVGYCCEKGCKIVTANLAGDWHEAAAQMAFTAGLNPALRDPSAHIVLTWGDGENPRDAEIIAAARMAMHEMGAARHQHVIAIHRDRLNVHAHIVLNLVHPITGKTLSMRQDYARLELACRRIERRLGWPPDRGRFDQAIVDGEVRLVPKPQAHWDAKRTAREAGLRPDPRGGRGAARRSGRRPLRDRMSTEVRRAARAAMETAAGWLQLHAGLMRLGLRYVRHGSGARIIEISSADTMPASHFGSAFSFDRMVRRLGRFIPGPHRADAAHGRRSAAREAYDQDRRARRDVVARLTARHREARVRIGSALQGWPRLVQSAFREALKKEQRDELVRLCRTIPLPVLRNDAYLRADGLSDPTQQGASRYPQATRMAKARSDGFSLSEPRLDHTLMRQIWFGGIRDNDGRRREPDAEDLSAQFRALSSGAAIMPRLGPHEDILGYAVVRERPGQGIVTVRPSSRLGLAKIGKLDAETCLIVADAALGLTISLQRPDDLVIIASPWPTRRQLAQIENQIGRRNAAVVEASPTSSAHFVRLKDHLPSVKQVVLSTPSERPKDHPPRAEQDEPDRFEGPSPFA
ncbi:relaxase/mobilization nuclease domain-containing protein [Paracoccus sp. TK19116]|uniref:Relaxase/mobilization nuclease domain-containing protein n=1 Tax=Paracoccus albicereus TaxID=2922394 RepID=A0ABT1MUH1_9RHOB|nr:relaxase/mobilization nuclease domain-containing protein [Paracoccus albicereus]MCQ0971960.1 relaxase/mobilization nuclease domain-containing protein [Paracoccus albicereus]